MDFRQAQADIIDLLAESPITSDSVILDVRELVFAGEIGLAFDTLCSWLYEDSLPLSRSFYNRLVSLSTDLEEPRSVDKLNELIYD